MKTIEIKGKQYVQVNERLKWFRENIQGYGLITEIISLDETQCTMQAKIIDKDGFVVAMGTAHEERDDKTSMVNKTSFVENCETSAWGRALGNFGIGIDESIATADEVLRAIAQQEQIAQSQDKPAEMDTLSLEKELETAKWTQGKHAGELIKETEYDYLKWYAEKGYNDHVKALCRVAIDISGLTPLAEGEEGLPF